MASIRRFFAAVIVIAVAILPATGQAFVSASPAAVGMSDHAGMPCCPRCKTQDESKATACILQCAALAGAILPAMIGVAPRAIDRSRPAFANETSEGLVRAPPTHP